MKVPVRITIMGHHIPVRYLKEIPQDDTGDPSYGEYDDIKKEILVSKVMHKTGEQLFGTVFHELCHAMLDITGQNTGLGHAREEMLVRAMENSFWQLISFRADAPGIKWREVKFPFESDESDEETE